MIHFRIRYEGLRDRLGSVRRRAALARAAWLGLLPPLLGLVLHIGGRAPGWPLAWLAAGLLVFAAAALWLTRPGAGARPEGVLDRRFRLDDLLVTAVEVDRRGPRGPIEARLLDDAATAVAQIGGARAIDHRASRREAETFLALALILAGLWLLAGTLGGPSRVPRLPELAGLDGLSAGAGGGRGLGEGGGQGDGRGGAGSAATEAMGLLAAGLGDHAAARGIAEALAAGDAAAAARAARSLADRSDALSPAGRADLGQTLAQLATASQDLDPALSAALAEAAEALARPTPGAPAGGIDRLAEALDGLDAGEPAADRPPAGVRGRAGPPAARLDLRPTPLALGAAPSPPAASPVSGAPAGPVEPAGPAQASARPVSGAPAPPAPPAPPGLAPPRVPWAMRALVRRYFASGAPP